MFFKKKKDMEIVKRRAEVWKEVATIRKYENEVLEKEKGELSSELLRSGNSLGGSSMAGLKKKKRN